MLLQERLKPYTLILASQSPRRRQLLTDAGFAYRMAERFECEERYPDTLAAEQVAPYLSRLKSEAYPRALAPHEILLTADTVVVAAGQVLGKPADRDEAIRMLRLLSGRAHEVVTGVTLRTAARSRCFAAHSSVRFRPLTYEEIVYYVDRYRPLDKAGSYGIQEWIGYVGIEGIEGSFYNVMGLPVQRLYCELESFLGELE